MLHPQVQHVTRLKMLHSGMRGGVVSCASSARLRAPRSYEWVDDATIAALVVPADRGPPPPQPPAPIGPSILDNTAGRTSQVLARGGSATQHWERVCALR